MKFGISQFVISTSNKQSGGDRFDRLDICQLVRVHFTGLVDILDANVSERNIIGLVFANFPFEVGQ